MKRWFPQSVGGQLLALLMLALVVTQSFSLLLLNDERNRAIRAALGFETAGRAAQIALLLQDAPPDLYPSILRSASSQLAVFDVGPDPSTLQNSAEAGPFLAQMADVLGDGHDIRADVQAVAAPAAMQPVHNMMMGGMTEPVQMNLSIRLTSGQWLNVRSTFLRPGLQWTPRALLPLVLMVLAVVAIALVTTRRIVGPMKALAQGADRLGRGLDAEPLAVTGPSEVQETTRAFNQMQSRMTRFVAERTRMLAALSHDLRSPLTAMRLRVEMLEDDDSTRLKALVEEMQQMLDSTLDYARAASVQEPVTTVDLADLLAKLAADVGARAAFIGSSAIEVPVRPAALTRALRNLIDNAVRYGGLAEITLTRRDGLAIITIADKGPGLPEDQLEHLFDPFVRLESSRSRETGGAGLGLPIARTVIRAHGGDVTLRNRSERGLEARVTLPL
jgi:hypothetical protein